MTLHAMTRPDRTFNNGVRARCDCGWTGPARVTTEGAWSDYYEHLYEAEREAGGFEDSPEAA